VGLVRVEGQGLLIGGVNPGAKYECALGYEEQIQALGQLIRPFVELHRRGCNIKPIGLAL